MVLFYDRQGIEISGEDWAELRRRGQSVIVARSYVGQTEISTVWLGIDHGFGHKNSRPVLFETMIFGDYDGEEYQQRYCTQEEALIGHCEVHAALKKAAENV